MSNIATLATTDNGRPITTPSNEITLVTAERLDLTLAPLTTSGGPLGLILTNTGNGNEAFDVDASTADSEAAVRLIAIDQDGDGRFDGAVDTVVTGSTPPLAAGAGVRLLIVLRSDRPMHTRLTVTAAAVTASGDPGLVATGLGDSGSDAVVGATGARASVTIEADAPTTGGEDAADARATLVKSQQVTAPDGSDRPVSGALVTYRLAAHFTVGVGTARLDDPIPVGTTYVPGSLQLDGTPLTDGADGDAGTADARAVTVRLGRVAAGADHIIQFQVRLS